MALLLAELANTFAEVEVSQRIFDASSTSAAELEGLLVKSLSREQADVQRVGALLQAELANAMTQVAALAARAVELEDLLDESNSQKQADVEGAVSVLQAELANAVAKNEALEQTSDASAAMVVELEVLLEEGNSQKQATDAGVVCSGVTAGKAGQCHSKSPGTAAIIRRISSKSVCA